VLTKLVSELKKISFLSVKNNLSHFGICADFNAKLTDLMRFKWFETVSNIFKIRFGQFKLFKTILSGCKSTPFFVIHAHLMFSSECEAPKKIVNII
jgi:hypothetical protein